MAVKTAPGTATRARGDGGERMAPDQLHQAGDRDPGPAGHAEPGGGDVDVEDAHALALQALGRRDEQADRRARRAISAPRASRARLSGVARFSGNGPDSRRRALLGAVCSGGCAAAKASDASLRVMRAGRCRSQDGRWPPTAPQQNRLLGIGLRIGATTCFGCMAAMIKLGHEAGVSTARAGLLPLRLRPAAAARLDRADPQFRRLADRAAARPSRPRRARPRDHDPGLQRARPICRSPRRRRSASSRRSSRSSSRR